MLDYTILKNDIESLELNLKRRNIDIDLKELTALDELRREMRFEAEKLRSEQKSLGKQIASADDKTKKELLDQASQMSEKVKELFEKVDAADKNFMDIWIKIPNLISATSPDGTSDKENSEIKKYGEIRNIDKPKDHLEIAESLGLIDVQKASEVSGSRFSYLFGDLVKIEFSLVLWAMQKLSDKGFKPTIPPVLVRENALYGTGFFPDDAEQVYEIPNDDLYLVGTSEVPLAALHSTKDFYFYLVRVL